MFGNGNIGIGCSVVIVVIGYCDVIGVCGKIRESWIILCS